MEKGEGEWSDGWAWRRGSGLMDGHGEGGEWSDGWAWRRGRGSGLMDGHGEGGGVV